MAMPSYREYHLQLPHFTFDNNRTVRLLYGLRVFRDLVNKSTLFFLPIFLYEFGVQSGFLDGFGLDELQKGMLAIALYFFSQGVFKILFGIPAAKMIKAVGYNWTIVFSHVLRLIAFALFYLTTHQPWLIFLAGMADGIQTPFFWDAYHTLVSKNTKPSHMGKDMGVLQALLQIAAAISPAIGGFLAFIFGIEILFLVGMVMTLAGTIFVLLMDDRKVVDTVSLREFFSWIKERQFQKLAIAYVGRYIYDAALFIWPLYVFFVLGSIDRVGYLYTVSLFGALLLSFFIGTYLDSQRRNKRPFLATGSVLSFLWLIRTQIVSIWSIALVDAVDKLISNFHWLFYDSALMRRAAGKEALSYFAYREMIIGAGHMIFWTLFGLFFLFDAGWESIFVFAAIGVFLSLTVSEKYQHIDYGQGYG